MTYTNNQIKNALNNFKNEIEEAINESENYNYSSLLERIDDYIINYVNSPHRTLKRDRIVTKIMYYSRNLRKMIFIDNKIIEFGSLTKEDIIHIGNQ